MTDSNRFLTAILARLLLLVVLVLIVCSTWLSSSSAEQDLLDSLLENERKKVTRTAEAFECGGKSSLSALSNAPPFPSCGNNDAERATNYPGGVLRRTVRSAPREATTPYPSFQLTYW